VVVLDGQYSPMAVTVTKEIILTSSSKNLDLVVLIWDTSISQKALFSVSTKDLTIKMVSVRHDGSSKGVFLEGDGDATSVLDVCVK
jgi:hypothetical protein